MTFTNPTIATDQITVLNAVVCRLIETVSVLTDKTCRVGLEDEELAEGVRDYLTAIVSPAEGRFLQPEQSGGGGNVLIEESTLLVTLHSRMKRDRSGTSEAVLSDSSSGLLYWKQKVLKSLVGWMATDGDNFLLTDYMYALNAGNPRHYRNDYATLKLVFSANFLWDLT